MKINDFLKENNKQLSYPLAALIVKAVEKSFPYLYLRFKANGCSNIVVADYFCNLDLNESDLNNILELINRYSKVWAVS